MALVAGALTRPVGAAAALGRRGALARARPLRSVTMRATPASSPSAAATQRLEQQLQQKQQQEQQNQQPPPPQKLEVEGDDPAGRPPSFAYDAASDSREPRAENVPGQFWIDKTCIDCDTCRMYAPDVFARIGRQSAVVAQPTDEAGRVGALQALLSCPTFSIHARERSSADLQKAQAGLPRPAFPGAQNVYLCGWRTERSFACESYLIVRPGGNVLVDSPRYNPVLKKRIEALGGAKYIFLTHRDDVADHAQWAKALGAQRILHAREVNEDTAAVEVKLEGEGPWRLPDGGDDAELIFTPGHTEAHVCLYYAPERALLTGDHLAAGWGGATLAVYKDFCWYDVGVQLESVRKLLAWDWLHVLPGHGRPAELKDAAHRLQAVAELMQLHGVAGDGEAVAA